MIRLLTVLLIMLLATPMLVSCGDEEASTQADELGIQEGKRPEKAVQRPPPGPRDSGFESGEAEDDADTPTDDDEED